MIFTKEIMYIYQVDDLFDETVDVKSPELPDVDDAYDIGFVFDADCSRTSLVIPRMHPIDSLEFASILKDYLPVGLQDDGIAMTLSFLSLVHAEMKKSKVRSFLNKIL